MTCESRPIFLPDGGIPRLLAIAKITPWKSQSVLIVFQLASTGYSEKKSSLITSTFCFCRSLKTAAVA